MNLQLKDQNVLLTGASGLIGQAIARAFATEGARLALLARRPPALDALCADVVATGAAAPITIECDLSSSAATDAAFATAAQRLGSLDVVVLAAGAAQGGVFWEIRRYRMAAQSRGEIIRQHSYLTRCDSAHDRAARRTHRRRRR
jgi:NAD(P)-dependent dehydrogenase (short-subunit alcohol dehydrogenase family)